MTINNNSNKLADNYNQARSPFGVQDILSFIHPGDRVLDGGCGTGQHVKYIAEIASEVVGIDTDSARIAIAKETCGNLVNTSFKVGSVTKLPFEDNTFDVMVIVQVLHHLGGEDVKEANTLRQECQQTIAEAKRVLRSGGRLILVTTSRQQRRTAYWHFNLFPQSAWERLDGVWSLTEGEWFESVLQQNGFTEIGKVTPPESHWLESQGEEMVINSLDPAWRSTDVAFDLLTPEELNQFIAQVETALNHQSVRKLLDNARAGRISHGEATIYAYELS